MLEAVLNQAGTMKKILDCLAPLIADTNIECTQEGMTLQSMDPSHVALITLNLWERGFDKFRCDGDRQLGVHVPTIARGWRLAGPNDKVTIVNNDQDNNLAFNFENMNEASQMNVTVKLLTLDIDAFATPEDEKSEAVITLPAKDFATLCNNCAAFGDSIRISVDKNTLTFVTIGTHGQVEVIRRERDALKGETVGVRIQADKQVSQSFSTKFLQFMSRCSTFAETCTLRLTGFAPMQISFDILESGATESVGDIRFFLAPKVEGEGMAEED